MEKSGDIGAKVKAIRKEKNITLKELSEQSGLSTGFLSQFERGMTTIAIDSLQRIATILGKNMEYFFRKSSVPKEEHPILRSYERKVAAINPRYVQFDLLQNPKDGAFLPRIYEVLPTEVNSAKTYSHQGVEFIYVLEGILTLHLKNKTYQLYPEDSIYFDSQTPHNWENNTSKMVRILTVNNPNPYQSEANFL